MRLRQEVTECSGNGHGERANGHKRAESGKRRATDSTGMSALRHHSTLDASMLPPFCRPGHNQKAVRHRAAVIGRCCVPKLAPCTSRANFVSGIGSASCRESAVRSWKIPELAVWLKNKNMIHSN